MYCAFSTTLKKEGLRWFISLPKNSISHFWQLADQFLAHFATSKAYKKTSASLINIKQGRDESLKNYLARFNRVALEMKDLPQAVAMHLILVDLKSRDFSKSLAKRPAQTMTELLTRSAKFINMEEVEAAKWQADRLV